MKDGTTFPPPIPCPPPFPASIPLPPRLVLPLDPLPRQVGNGTEVVPLSVGMRGNHRLDVAVQTLASKRRAGGVKDGNPPPILCPQHRLESRPPRPLVFAWDQPAVEWIKRKTTHQAEGTCSGEAMASWLSRGVMREA